MANTHGDALLSKWKLVVRKFLVHDSTFCSPEDDGEPEIRAHAHFVWCLDQALRGTRERRRESRIFALLLLPPSLLLDQWFQVRLPPGTQQKQAIARQEQVANQAANPIPGAAQDGGNGPAVQDRKIWDQISAGMKDD